MDFHEEVLKLAELPLKEDADDKFYSSDISLIYDEFNKNIIKINKSQKEISYNVEEIYEFIQDLKEEERNKSIEYDLVNSLISIVDIIEDFYVFATSEKDLNVISHAEMLWRSILKKLSLFGLARIYDEKTKLDVIYNTTIGTDSDKSLPEGYILKTIKSGYIYKNKVIRKSLVIVNKY